MGSTVSIMTARVELTTEQRDAAIRAIESYVGPNLAGWPHLPRVYFGGAVDAIIYAVNNNPERGTK
jgi:hypothetical protein